MRTHITRGFTLIELLVVIAIIAVLASVVLASLNSARNKGNDAAIQANLGSIRVQAELVYDSSGNSYAGVCGNPTVASALSAAASASSATVDTVFTNPGLAGKVTCHSNDNAWVVASPLKTTPSIFWCVDSTGKAATTSTAVAASGTVCL